MTKGRRRLVLISLSLQNDIEGRWIRYLYYILSWSLEWVSLYCYYYIRKQRNACDDFIYLFIFYVYCNLRTAGADNLLSISGGRFNSRLVY